MTVPRRASVAICAQIGAFFCLFLIAAPAQTDTIQLNCTDRNWYPFIYTEQEQIRGIFIDIARQALDNLEMDARLTPVPYRRAINNSRKGKIDGIVGIGFSAALAKRLDFPPDAANGKASKWHIARVDHVVVSAAKDAYRFTGDKNSLPSPIRLRQGSIILQELEEAGVVTHELRDDIQGIRQLGRDGTGVVITTSVYAEKIIKDTEFKGRFRIHGHLLTSRSYYLAFAKGSRLSRRQKTSLWEEIRRLRNDYIFMLQVYSRY